MKRTVVLLLVFAAGFISCSKEHTQPTGLVGTWNWVYSTGGIVGVTQTPASTGETRSVEFSSNGQFQSDINGNLRYGQYQIVTAHSILTNSTTNQLHYSSGPNQTFVLAHDSLILDDEAYDGFRTIFVRR
jgi:hypothetical protein